MKTTRERILATAARLFHGEGIHAVSLDAIAAAAGVTKRTIYYHFRSKQDLIEAWLKATDEPTLAFIRAAWDQALGSPAARIEAVFRAHAALSRKPRWKGCGVLRTTVELVNSPGHPAQKVGRAHKKRLEDWLAARFNDLEPGAARQLAREIVVLHDGALAVVLLHREPAYFEVAGRAAATLVTAAGLGTATEAMTATGPAPTTNVARA